MIMLFSSNLNTFDALLILVLALCVILLAIERLEESLQLELSIESDDLNKTGWESLTSLFQIDFTFLSDLFQNLSAVLHAEYSWAWE